MSDPIYEAQAYAIAKMARSISALEDENAKLRAERDHLLMNSNPTATELRRVRSAWKKDRDENAKLRELVLDLYDAIDSVFWDGEVETRKRFEPRMSELGIEVEE